MRILRSDLAACRAVIAVAALYALALQSVLGGMVGVRVLDPAHILCLSEADAGSRPDAPPVHVHPACCTAAQVASPLDAPAPDAVVIVWPARRAVAVSWRPEIVATPGRPGVSASARAPPVV